MPIVTYTKTTTTITTVTTMSLELPEALLAPVETVAVARPNSRERLPCRSSCRRAVLSAMRGAPSPRVHWPS